MLLLLLQNTGYEPPCNSQPFPGAIDEYSQQQRPSDYAIQQQHGSSSRSPGGYDSSNGQMNFHALPGTICICLNTNIVVYFSRHWAALFKR